jgi:SAM-dependent methyltransferase
VNRPAYEPARCVVCGHADAALIADADAVHAEHELLWSYHERRLRPTIPPARLVDRVAFSEPPPFRLVRCLECGLVYRNPIERARELNEIYARKTPPHDALRALFDGQRGMMHAQARRLRAVLGRGGSGLEVGSYVGAFLTAARDVGLNMEGLDVNAGTNDFARSLGLTVHDGELTTFDTDRTFDVIAIWNTFDQLADPRAALIAAHKLLRPGGLLVIRVPNGACYASLRQRLRDKNPVSRAAARAVLAQNNLLGFPYRWGFNQRALARLLGDAGLSVTRVRGDALVRLGDEWTRGWARAEEAAIKALIRVLARRNPNRAPWIEVFAGRAQA